MSVGLCLSSRSHLAASHLAELAREADRRGFNWLFVNESGNNALLTAAIIGMATGTSRIGTGVVNIFMRHPIITAASALTLADVTGNRFVLGLGTGHQLVNEGQLGIRMEKPLSRIKEYLNIVRQCIDEGRIDYEGHYYHARDSELMLPTAVSPIPIYMAVLGLRAAFLAGQIADGVILNFATLQHVVKIIESLRNGASQSGRVFDALTMVCFIQTILVAPGQEAVALQGAKRIVGRYGRLKFYRDMFAESGFEKDASMMEKATTEDELIDAASEELVKSVMLVGSPERCLERMEEYRKAGVQVPVIYPNAYDGNWSHAIHEMVEVFAPC